MDSPNLPHPVKPKLPIIGARSNRSHSLGNVRRFLTEVDISPVAWNKYWTSCEDVKIATGEESSSSSSAEDVFRVYRKGSEGPLVVLLHGGGYSALTWSLVVEEISALVTECQLLAFDQRGHGSTKTVKPEDMDADTLAKDVGRVLKAVFPDSVPGPVILVGHSLGGAIAVHAEHINAIDAAVAGVIVIDVVEGTALAALSSMHNVLACRPTTFKSLKEAILWSYRTGQTRNLEAAKVSMPGQIKNSAQNICAADEVEPYDSEAPVPSNAPVIGVDECSVEDIGAIVSLSPGTSRFTGRRLSCRRLSVDNENKIDEEEENEEDVPIESYKDRRKKLMHNEEFRRSFDTKRLKQCSMLPPTLSNPGKYTWSIDLTSTSQHWMGWFEGLSLKFLSISPPKLLLLAGVDRLDTELCVGQMQGKFQMQVVGKCGHAVHEDAPDEVANAIISFLTRHKMLKPKNPAMFHVLPGC